VPTAKRLAGEVCSAELSGSEDKKVGDRRFLAGHPLFGSLAISDRGYSGGLRAFSALADLELDSLILFEGAEAAALDLRVMNEDVIRTAVGGDEAEAFFAVEPFHSSLCHIKVLLSFFLQNA
jgi:hypothetical protein